MKPRTLVILAALALLARLSLHAQLAISRDYHTVTFRAQDRFYCGCHGWD